MVKEGERSIEQYPEPRPIDVGNIFTDGISMGFVNQNESTVIEQILPEENKSFIQKLPQEGGNKTKLLDKKRLFFTGMGIPLAFFVATAVIVIAADPWTFAGQVYKEVAFPIDNNLNESQVFQLDLEEEQFVYSCSLTDPPSRGFSPYSPINCKPFPTGYYYSQDGYGEFDEQPVSSIYHHIFNESSEQYTTIHIGDIYLSNQTVWMSIPNEIDAESMSFYILDESEVITEEDWVVHDTALLYMVILSSFAIVVVGFHGLLSGRELQAWGAACSILFVPIVYWLANTFAWIFIWG